MDEPLVVATNVSRRFGQGDRAVEAVREASCAVYPGDRIALTGPSGSGKSTLLHLLGGLDTPTAGDVTWPALGPRAALRPGKVVDIFQGASLLPPLSVLENVRLPLVLLGQSDQAATWTAAAALARFGLEGLGDLLPEELSGGQAQRVAIVRALAVKPALVLADEPTGQLDTETAFSVLGLLVDCLDEIGAAMVLSTHDPRVAGRLTTTWTMRDGCLRTEVETERISPQLVGSEAR